MDEKITYINSQIVCAQIELGAMKAQNENDKNSGQRPRHDYQDFLAIMDKYYISHNAVLGYLRN